MKHYRQLKTGGDPRAQADYMALCTELGKLTHPARPDVNWPYAEKLCLALFEQNGIDLQTAAWYTHVRTQLAGLAGLNEGLAILETLLNRQWGRIWPTAVHARLEILTRLSVRLQQGIRALTLSNRDLSQLYQAEQQVIQIGVALQRQELKHASQIEMLRILLHTSAVRLEAGTEQVKATRGVLPGIAADPVAFSANELSSNLILAEPVYQHLETRWVYISEPEHQAEPVAKPPHRLKSSRLVITALSTLLVIGGAMLWWEYDKHREPSLEALLVGSVTPLPRALTAAQLDSLHLQKIAPPPLIDETGRQLTRLTELAPDWNIRFGHQLVEQAQTLWPNRTLPLARQWQQQLDAISLPDERLTAWHRGMIELDQLSNKLNSLDDKKGKYLTVSELKSIVFAATQAFNQGIPAEEQLRVLAQYAQEQPASMAKKAQLERHLQQLIAGYAELQQRPWE